MSALTLDDNQAAYQIRSYRPGRIQINEKIFTQSVIVAPDQIIEHWAPQTALEINTASLASIIELKPDILLIGTGHIHIFLPAEAYGEMINLGIGVEMMATGAAARTFNALASENRRVVAALVL